MAKDIFDLIDSGTPSASEKQIKSASDEKPSIFDYVPEEKQAEQAQPIEELDLKKPESAIQAGLRHGARTATRIAETPVEVAKGISSLPQRGIEFLFEHITGSPLSEEAKKKISSFHEQFGGLAQQLPSTEKIRETEKKYTGEYLQPQSKGEELSDEITQDLTAFMLPMPGTTEARIVDKLARGAKIVGAGQAAKQSARAMGASEDTQDYAKFGTMFFSSLWKPSGAKKLGSELYKKAEQSLPKGASGDARQLENNMNNLKERMQKGGEAASEEFVIKGADTVLKKIKEGKMTFEEAVAVKRSLNERSQEFLYSTPDKLAKARARKLYGDITHDLNKFIGQAEESHPVFYKNQKDADQVFGTLAQSRTLSNFIGKHSAYFGTVGVSPIVGKLFTGDITGAVGTAGVIGAGAGAIKTGELMYRVAKSPVLRKYYLNVLNSAASENASTTAKNMKIFQNKLEEEDPEVAKILGHSK